MFGRRSPSSPMCRSRKSTSVSTPTAESSTTTSSSNSLPPSFTHPSASTSSSILDPASLRFSSQILVYPFSELSSSITSFLSSNPPYITSLRNNPVVILTSPYHPPSLSLLPSLSRSHHSSLAPLLGISLPPHPSHLYLVYSRISGSSLLSCLRSPHNPSFTPLSKWITRMKIASDVAHGLDYIHLHANTIHNRLKSSTIIVADDLSAAKITHFGAAALSGELLTQKHIRGTRGYIAPEVISGSPVSQRSDVFAFGVVLLELISGNEPLKYHQQNDGQLVRISVIESAREAIGTEDEDGAVEEEERWGRVRRWVDRRMKDSFPVEVVERLIRVALRCVEDEPWMRPDMTWVAGKVSKLYLESVAWDEKMALPTDFSLSLAPR